MNEHTRYGTVVVFPKGTTHEQATAIVDAIREACPKVEALQPQRFDDRHGGPVWYVP